MTDPGSGMKCAFHPGVECLCPLLSSSMDLKRWMDGLTYTTKTSVRSFSILKKSIDLMDNKSPLSIDYKIIPRQTNGHMSPQHLP